MKTYVVYDERDGRVVSVNTCPSSAYMPRQGPLKDSLRLSVKHGTCCPLTERVEHGRFVPERRQVMFKRERATGWAAFRLMRGRILGAKEYLLAAHYPASEEDRAATLAKFQLSRDIPTETKDPAVAMTMLNAIWSTT